MSGDGISGQQIYWAFHTKCQKFKPQALLNYLQKRVTQENLADVISHIRIEKGIAKKGEYYFYLGIHRTVRGNWSVTQKVLQKWLSTLSPDLRIPPNLQAVDFRWEEIRPMVGTAYDLEGDIQPIPYLTVSQPLRLDPLVLEVPVAEGGGDDRTEACEHLLWWLSAAGGGSLPKFQAVCTSLGLEKPRRLLRRLQLLGHLTVSPNGQRWQMQPPSLQLVSPNTYMVYGQRHGALGEVLRHFGQLRIEPQPNRDAPPCWQFQPQTDWMVVLAKLAKDYPSLAVRPVAIPLPWADWKAGCTVVDWVPLHRYQLGRFDGKDFVSLPTFTQETGFYELHEEQTGRKHYLFYDGDRHTWLSGEWYGLRFWAMTCLFPGKLSVLYADQSLKIPLAQRWPLAYERYLVMQSGFLPRYDHPSQTLCYSNISVDVAQAAIACL